MPLLLGYRNLVHPVQPPFRLPHRVKRGKSRLVSVRLLWKDVLKHRIVPLSQRIERAEICGQMKYLSASFLDLFLHKIVGVDIGPPEPEYRLLRVAHQKQRPRPWRQFVPVFLLRVGPRQIKENLCLDRVCVLELIDQDMRIPPAEISPDLRIFPEQPRRQHQLVLEVQFRLTQPLFLKEIQRRLQKRQNF